MKQSTKILIGVAVLIVGAIVAYMILGSKGSKTTSTTTSTGLHGLDLTGLLGAMGKTDTISEEELDEEFNDDLSMRTGGSSLGAAEVASRING